MNHYIYSYLLAIHAVFVEIEIAEFTKHCNQIFDLEIIVMVIFVPFIIM